MAMLKSPGHGKPTKTDWASVRILIQLLEKFEELTTNVSASYYTTSNTYLHNIFSCAFALQDWCSDNNTRVDLREMSKVMKTKWDKYWGDPEKMNVLMFLGAFFDPRYKIKFVKFAIDTMYPKDKAKIISDNVVKVLYSMFEEYSGCGPCGSVDNSHKAIGGSRDLSVAEQPRGLADMLFIQHLDESSQENQTELDEYMAEALLKVKKDLDILNWWKSNSIRFPILALMARDILAIPISTVASESAFSTGRRILDPFRSSLTPRVVEGLICVQDWMKGLDISELQQEEADTMDNDLQNVKDAPSIIEVPIYVEEEEEQED